MAMKEAEREGESSIKNVWKQCLPPKAKEMVNWETVASADSKEPARNLEG